MRKLLSIGFVLCLLASPALAADNYAATAGSGLTFAAKNVAGVLYPWWIPANSSGTELFTSGNAAYVQFPSAQAVTAAQATASNLNATVVGTGTFAVQATLQPSATTAIGKVDPNTIATWGLAPAGGTSSSPTNALVSGCQYNSSAPTFTSGDSGAVQCTAAGSVHTTVDNTNANGRAAASSSSPVTLDTGVNVTAGAAAGGSLIQVGGSDGTNGRIIKTDSNGNLYTVGTGATGAAAPAGAVAMGAVQSGATGGYLKNLTACDNHTYVHITSATDTLVVQGVSSQTVYVCGMLASGAGTATVALENTASTNANCSSTKTQISGLITAGTASANGFYNPIWGGLKNTSGNGLCIVSTGTGGVDVDVWYTQL